MARIRTIKPEFFTSEDIVSLSPLARLLYIAIWCESDRDGCLNWKPKTFKLRYLPADNCDVESLCNEIVNQGLVKLYGDGLAYIPSFATHQHVNPRESVSTLPKPDALPTRADASNLDMHAQVGKERKGRERKGKEGEELLSEAEASDPCPHQEIISIYHETLPVMPRVRDWTPTRQTKLRARWKEKPERQSLDWWRDYFDYVAKSDFLCGRTEKPFNCDLEWLLSRSNLTKVCEGKYENRGSAA